MAESRKTYSITFNKGIDKASLPFEANPARALDELNYIYRDGKVQKRHGFKHILQYEAEEYYARGDNLLRTNETQINGIWRFLAEDNQYHTVVHIGSLLYELDEDNELHLFFYARWRPLDGPSHLYPKCYDLLNEKSTAVIGNKSLYVLGGKTLLRVRFRQVEGRTAVPISEDEDTYIPTTTISITYQNAKVSGRSSLDQVNLVTPMRKNRLLSGVGLNDGGSLVYSDSTYGYVYQLDSPIVVSVSSNFSDHFKIRISRRKM